MKITRKGSDPKNRVWRGSCTNCGAAAEAGRSEMTHIVHGDQRDPGPTSWEVCPECGKGDKSTGYGGMLFYEVIA